MRPVSRKAVDIVISAQEFIIDQRELSHGQDRGEQPQLSAPGMGYANLGAPADVQPASRDDSPR